MPTSLLREVALRPPGTDIFATIDRLISSEKLCICPCALCPRFFPWGSTPRELPQLTARRDNYPDTAGLCRQIAQQDLPKLPSPEIHLGLLEAASYKPEAVSGIKFSRFLKC